MSTENLILKTDSYKVAHSKAYPKGLQKIYSYLEARGGIHPEIVFFGLQYYLKKYLSGVQVTKEKIDEAEAFYAQHFGRTDTFNREGWEYILNVHNGRLPLEIKAVPEGTRVGLQNVLMTIANTDEACYWLTNYIETLLMKIWYPISQATRSYYIRKDIKDYLELSGTPEAIDFKCHDFGYRGVTSEEHAAIGGGAHLLSFMGTDTVEAIKFLQDYYSAGMCGFSIPATEHSIMCSFGRDGEIKACENLLNVYPDGLIACVSDTYDIFNACANIWGGVLKDKVLARNGCLVIRPDSGDPVDVICGKALKVNFSSSEMATEDSKIRQKIYELMCSKFKPIKYIKTSDNKYYQLFEYGLWSCSWTEIPESDDLKGILQILWDKFGGIVNDKGYKVLDPHVRLIQGDGMNPETIKELYKHITDHGWSADNLTVGSGGGLLVKGLDRDTYKFAIKASAAMIDDQWIGLQKDPITDSGKKSKMGRLKLVKTEEGYKTISSFGLCFDTYQDELITVFKDGELLVDQTLEEIKNNLNR
jgi:nicotinic acid phosphoribosyltransferase